MFFKLTRKNLIWQMAIVGGTSLYLFFVVIYFFLGQLNADEGWYLYASKLVFEGNIPYRDFAYTQPPLLPYLYGLSQINFHESLYLGRATSVFFSISNFVLSILLARRYAGKVAGCLTALLFGTFVYGIYFGTIVKTYALISFFFTLTFFVLSSKIKNELKYSLAVLLVISATLVRLSALFFAIPVILYALIAKGCSTTKYVVIILCITGVAITLPFTASDLQCIKWNLLTHHISQWGDISDNEKIMGIFFSRILDLISYFKSYFILTCTGIFMIFRTPELRRRIKPFIQRHPEILIVIISLVLFSVIHLGTGGWHLEYFIPTITSFFPVIAIMIRKTFGYLRTNFSTILLQVVFISTLFFASSQNGYGWDYVDTSGGQSPIEEIKEVSTFISQYTEPSDKILVMEALWVALVSNRTTLPGMTMSQFSYQDVNRKSAEQLKLVNGEIVLEYINSRAAKIVVLTDHDWQLFQSTSYDDLIRQALANQYKFVLAKENFGQRGKAGSVYVYLLREKKCYGALSLR